MAKDKAKFGKDDQNLSEIIADNNPLVKSDPEGRATPARGYQKSND